LLNLQVPGVDDVTGEPLIRRADDNPETLKQRLKVKPQFKTD